LNYFTLLKSNWVACYRINNCRRHNQNLETLKKLRVVNRSCGLWMSRTKR